MMTLFIAIVSSGMVFSSFTVLKEKMEISNSQSNEDPPYWRGHALIPDCVGACSIYIIVYRTSGNVFYAVKSGETTKLSVKVNSRFISKNYADEDLMKGCKYYVYYDNQYYYFNMN